MTNKPKNIVVVGSHRSGTNLLCLALTSGGKTVFLGEIFQNTFGDHQGWKQRVDGWRKPIIQDIFGQDEFPFVSPGQLKGWPDIPNDFVCREFFKAILSGEYASDIKGEMSQFATHWISKILFHQLPLSFQAWRLLVSTPNTTVIYLKRRNLLNILVSAQRALKLTEWLILTNNDAEPEDIMVELQPAATLENFTFIQRYYDYLDVWCRPYKNIIPVVYEDLVADDYQGIRDLAKQIGMPGEPKIATKKQINKPHIECISNLDELQDYFKDSKWSHLFQKT